MEIEIICDLLTPRRCNKIHVNLWLPNLVVNHAYPKKSGYKTHKNSENALFVNHWCIWFTNKRYQNLGISYLPMLVIETGAYRLLLYMSE